MLRTTFALVVVLPLLLAATFREVESFGVSTDDSVVPSDEFKQFWAMADERRTTRNEVEVDESWLSSRTRLGRKMAFIDYVQDDRNEEEEFSLLETFDATINLTATQIITLNCSSFENHTTWTVHRNVTIRDCNFEGQRLYIVNPTKDVLFVSIINCTFVGSSVRITNGSVNIHVNSSSFQRRPSTNDSKVGMAAMKASNGKLVIINSYFDGVSVHVPSESMATTIDKCQFEGGQRAFFSNSISLITNSR